MKRYAFWTAEITGALSFPYHIDITDRNYKAPIDIPMTWFEVGSFSIPFGIYIDKLSLVMLLIATGLGLLDIHFAHDYMGEDPHQPRYYAKVLFLYRGDDPSGECQRYDRSFCRLGVHGSGELPAYLFLASAERSGRCRGKCFPFYPFWRYFSLCCDRTAFLFHRYTRSGTTQYHVT